ncbi:MAG: hypothetical protein FLDDKLPJ_00879 [Phycisphaerae bacterium]|nr:hypothetical protein [Phycisphaerae bacterium]
MRVFLVQHSHSDPGYTHPRDEVRRHQLRNIARSVAFSREDPEYRFTVECFWMIDEALRRGCALPDGFIEAARAGRIGLTATYLNGSDHLDAEDYRRMLRVARRFCDEHAIPLRSAMQCDVNGVNACMPDLLNEVGVTRMSFAINDERGGAPFTRPNAFLWRGPGGGRILAYNGFVYLRANEYGMHRGFEAFCDGARRLAEDLVRAGHTLPVCLLQGCGTYDDNGLAAPWMARMARAWRESAGQRAREDARGSAAADAGSPAGGRAEALYREFEFVPATIDEFFDALEACGASFPEYAGTWPDWWSDGLASAPLELKRAYEARRTLRAIEPLLDDEDKAVGTVFEAAQRDVWMYLEHTFGSWRSVGEPEAPDSKRQWADKSRLAHRAAEEAALLAEDVLAARANADGAVCFPPECRDAQYVVSQVPSEDFPESGEIVFESNAADVRAWVIAAKRPQTMATLITWARPSGDPVVTLHRKAFIPGRFRLSNRVNPAPSMWGRWTPSVVCERIRGTRQQLRNGDPTLPIDRVAAEVQSHVIEDTSLWKGLRCGLRAPGWRDLTLTCRSWNNGVTFEFVVSGVIEAREAPHATFLAMTPVDRADEVFAETGGHWHRPGVDELPGGCRDWHVVHQGVEIRGRDGMNVAVWSPDAPVVHFGGINTGRWGRDVHPQNGALAFCLYHNYWYVNFPATAHGRMTYRFRVAAGQGLGARSLLESWSRPFLVFVDSPRARALRERRLPRLGGAVIE